MNIENLYWWRPKPRLHIFPRRLNLGDALSPYIVRFGALTAGLTDEANLTRRMLAIGSILNHAQDGDLVWGSGFHGGKSSDAYRFTKLDVRAVRGPLTARFLKSRGINPPEAMGDPGILLPLALPADPDIVKLGPIIIPHYSNRNKFSGDTRVLRTLGRDIPSFARAIQSATVVLSASLHGIILAESYGVPAVMVANTQTETIDKYRDYYESTGRSKFPIATSFESAAYIEPPSLPQLGELQQGLLASFPVDAWRR